MNTFNISEFSKLVRRSVKTLQRWDRDGVLVANRTRTNRRYYTEQHVIQALGEPAFEMLKDYADFSAQNPTDADA